MFPDKNFNKISVNSLIRQVILEGKTRTKKNLRLKWYHEKCGNIKLYFQFSRLLYKNTQLLTLPLILWRFNLLERRTAGWIVGAGVGTISNVSYYLPNSRCIYTVMGGNQSRPTVQPFHFKTGMSSRTCCESCNLLIIFRSSINYSDWWLEG